MIFGFQGQCSIIKKKNYWHVRHFGVFGWRVRLIPVVKTIISLHHWIHLDIFFLLVQLVWSKDLWCVATGLCFHSFLFPPRNPCLTLQICPSCYFSFLFIPFFIFICFILINFSNLILFSISLSFNFLVCHI